MKHCFIKLQGEIHEKQRRTATKLFFLAAQMHTAELIIRDQVGLQYNEVDAGGLEKQQYCFLDGNIASCNKKAPQKLLNK